MARAATRFRTAFSKRDRHRETDRLDVARQTQRVALAPDRGPGLAPRDPQVPRTHENRCMPQGGGPRHRIDRSGAKGIPRSARGATWDATWDATRGDRRS